MENDVFISYTQPNRNEARYIHDMLQYNGITSWMAESRINGISTGDDYDAKIVRGIKNSKVFLLVYSDYCNKSTETIKEVWQLTGNHKLIIVKLDNSNYSEGLSYHLKGFQYIDASRNNLTEMSNKILTDARKMIGMDTGDEIESTDKLLFKNGLDVFNKKIYEQATRHFTQHLEIAPHDNETRFYLSLSIVAGRKTRKLHGREVHELERILLPGLNSANPGFIGVLLSIIKQGYYASNGFPVPKPTIEELMRGVMLDEQKAGVLLNHLNEPENTIWKTVETFYKQRK